MPAWPARYRLRSWVNDVNPPLIRLLTTRVSAGRPTIAIQTLDRGAGVDPFSLVLSYGRVLVGAAAYDPFSGIALFPLPAEAPRIRAGRVRATFQSADYQEAKNADVFGRDLMPNTRVRATRMRVVSGPTLTWLTPLARTCVGRSGAAARRRRPERHRPHRALLRREAADPRAAAEHRRALRDDVAEPRGKARSAHPSRGRADRRQARRGDARRPRLPVAVVTGGSSGIGAAVARLLAEKGWHCVLVARNEERLAAVADEIGGEYEVCDVGDREAVERMAAEVGKRHPAVKLLVNNAGISSRGKGFVETDPEWIEQLLRINLLGAVWCLRAFLPALEADKPSHVVNVASVAGHGRPPARALLGVEARARGLLPLAGRVAACAGHPRPHGQPRLRRDARLSATGEARQPAPRADGRRARSTRPAGSSPRSSATGPRSSSPAGIECRPSPRRSRRAWSAACWRAAGKFQFVTVEFLYWEGCPSHDEARELLEEVLRERGLDAQVRGADTSQPARRRRSCASPAPRRSGSTDATSIRSEPTSRPSLTCRIYHLPDGRVSPIPSREQLEEALA